MLSEPLIGRTVAEALAGFQPRRRTALERVALADAAGRIPALDVASPVDLPGFERSAMDGYAVCSADTATAGEAPVELALVAAHAAVEPGSCRAIATGGELPPGADAVVPSEQARGLAPGRVGILRAAPPRQHVVGAAEDVARDATIAAAGQALSAARVGLLAAAGVTSLICHALPRVSIIATGDEVVPADAEQLRRGQVRDAASPALAALVRAAGGEPVLEGIVPDDPLWLGAALRRAVDSSDVVLVSAGSSVGARDGTAAAISELGAPGLRFQGLALRPGRPTLLAEVGEVPLLGLPGNPLAALVVFQLVGRAVLQRVAGVTRPAPAPSVIARLRDAAPSAAGRMDVVPVRLEGALAVPLSARATRLSALAAADGLVRIDEGASGLEAGAAVIVELLP